MKTFAVISALLLAGCANISHTRQIVTEGTDTNGVKIVQTKRESESARFFMQREAAGRVFTTTIENGTNYTHRAGATNAQASGDVELVNAIGNAISSGIGSAAKGAVQGAK